MGESIKGRAKIGANGVTEVKIIIKHPMVVEMRDPKTGAVTTEAHFIEQISCMHKGELVFAADWGMAVSTNPYIEFGFTGGAAGDKVTFSWQDNKGQSDSADIPLT